MAGLWAWSVYFSKTKWAILIPFMYVMTGLFVALISGSIVGMDSLIYFDFDFLCTLLSLMDRFYTCSIV